MTRFMWGLALSLSLVAAWAGAPKANKVSLVKSHHVADGIATAKPLRAEAPSHQRSDSVSMISLTAHETYERKGSQELLAQMQNLVHSKGKVGLTPEEKAFIQEIQALWKEDIMPAIMAGIEEGQAEINSLFEAILECEAHLGEDQDKLTDFVKDTQDNYEDLKECVEKESDLLETKKKECKEVKEMKMDTVAIKPTPPGTGASNDERLEYLKQMNAYFCGSDEKFEDLLEECTEATENHTDVSENCTKIQHEYESDICAWFKVHKEAVDNYEKCRKDTIARYLGVPGASTVAPTTTTASTLPPAGGLLAEFFYLEEVPEDLSVLEGKVPDVTRIDPKIEYPETREPWEGLEVTNNFGAKFTGSLRVEEPGTYTIILESDDGSKLILDEEEVIDNDEPHKLRNESTEVDLTEGDHPIIVEYFEKSGDSGLTLYYKGPDTDDKVVVVPPEALVPPVEGKTTTTTTTSEWCGLYTEYFYLEGAPTTVDVIDGKEPDIARIESKINYQKTKDPLPGLAVKNNFGIRFTGSLIISKPGTYTLTLQSDDGSTLTLDDQEVLDFDGPHGMKAKSVDVELSAGEHPMVVKYFDKSGDHGVIFSYSGPDTNGEDEVVDCEALVPPAWALPSTTATPTPSSTMPPSGAVDKVKKIEEELHLDYIAAVRIECLWDAWDLAETPCLVDEEKVEECYEMPINMTNITIIYPDIPDPHDITDPDLPPLDDHPCTNEFTDAHYALMDVDEETLQKMKDECKPC
eukprot:CAMPEP_0178398656 /NCGR_PEP_ID=MMETSP0689_2-20121128/14884_1 /TAXON_ID=160604 /ORGANISM="Amphidinium massartii, Strain CS-259" /LENGTH=748 /DNA_ID=CAMNT_0020019423 /DNA_START=32 /DNA_END=2278 /DNA_ORIENTATION=-